MATDKPKLYYCAEKKAVCSVTSCSKGKELKHCPEASQEALEVEDGPDNECARGFAPGKITTRLVYLDGTEELVDGAIRYRQGCV